MVTFLIVIAVILWVGLKSYRKVQEQFDLADADEAPHRPARPAVETLFENDAPQSKEQPYFTYETMDGLPADKSEQPDVKAEAAVEAEPAAAFNLRQAVIYQTILNNNYISEYQHQ